MQVCSFLGALWLPSHWYEQTRVLPFTQNGNPEEKEKNLLLD